jgi:hypothetical protein
MLVGGKVFEILELPNEKRTARDYCRTVDKLLRRLDISKRIKFSKLLDEHVGNDLCRAR